MTVAQAAQRIGISASKVYQLVASRQIGHYRIGGKIVFSEADIATYLENCRVGPVSPASPSPRMRVKLKHLAFG